VLLNELPRLLRVHVRMQLAVRTLPVTLPVGAVDGETVVVHQEPHEVLVRLKAALIHGASLDEDAVPNQVAEGAVLIASDEVGEVRLAVHCELHPGGHAVNRMLVLRDDDRSTQEVIDGVKQHLLLGLGSHRSHSASVAGSEKGQQPFFWKRPVQADPFGSSPWSTKGV
jgi:hypothetical protein